MVGDLDDESPAAAIFDGDESTAWSVSGEKPVDYIIDLGESENIRGFKYLPDQGKWSPGIIFNYEFYVSTDGKNWNKPVSKGEFSNIKNSPIWQTKEFVPVEARFVKLRAISPAEENGRIGMAEFDLITQ